MSDEEESDRGDIVVAQLASRSWDELGVLEHAGYLLFPDKLYRRTASGKFEGTDVWLRVPRQYERKQARLKARAWAADEKLDPDKDHDLFEDMETMVLLSMCVRGKPPHHEPWEPDPKSLERMYDRGSLEQLYGKLDALARLIDPREGDLDEAHFWAAVAAIAAERSIRPLHVFDGSSQARCVIGMADRLLSYSASRSSSESSEPSTPAP